MRSLTPDLAPGETILRAFRVMPNGGLVALNTTAAEVEIPPPGDLVFGVNVFTSVRILGYAIQ